MPATPLRENLVSLIRVCGFSVLGCWLAADFADLESWKNRSPQETVSGDAQRLCKRIFIWFCVLPVAFWLLVYIAVALPLINLLV